MKIVRYVKDIYSLQTIFIIYIFLYTHVYIFLPTTYYVSRIKPSLETIWGK
jgi:hypothetical protein